MLGGVVALVAVWVQVGGAAGIYSFTHLLDTTAQIQQMCPFRETETPGETDAQL